MKIDTLALVCPDPPIMDHVAMLVGTNTSMMGRLLQACRKEGGDDFLHTLKIHPVVKEAYKQFQSPEKATPDDRRGTVWYIRKKVVNLPAGGVCQLVGTVRFPNRREDKIVLVDSISEDENLNGVAVCPEMKPVSAVAHGKKITVTLRNTSLKTVSLKPGTAIAHLYPVDIVSTSVKAPVKPPEGIPPERFDFGDSPVPEDWKATLCEKMAARAEVFSQSEWDLGCAKGVEHEIRLHDERPFRERSRRLPPADFEDVRKHLQELQNAGIISPSRSPYASPIVVVRKKNGKIRMCVDYRTLNRRTIPDQYTMPKIEDALHSLSGSKWFSVLDLRSGYYQVPMGPSDKEKTAFICPLGFYQFERMPQGISNAPATFQRVMERAVGDMNMLEVLVYLDDLIIFGRTLE